MSFSGGVFTINTSGQPVVAGTVISATTFNALTADLATGLSTCVLKDGTQTTTSSVPFAAGLSSNALVDLSNASAGQIKFPATQNASSNANTLDDYKEVDWVPTDGSGASLSFTITGTCQATKIGQMCFAQFSITWPVTASGATATIASLPWTAANNGSNSYTAAIMSSVGGGTIVGRALANTATFILSNASTGAAITNVSMSTATVVGVLVYRATA